MKSPSSTSSSKSPRHAFAFVVMCAVFAVVLLAGHAVLYLWRFHKDTPEALLRLDMAVRNRNEILFLGDSTLFFPAPDDTDVATIPDMLASLLPEYRVAPVQDAAYDLGMYESLCQYVAKTHGQPRLIIFPINLRMCAPQLAICPYRYFDKEMLFLEHDTAAFRMMFRPLAIFKTFQFRSVSPQSFLALPVLDGDQDLGPLAVMFVNPTAPATDDERARVIKFCFMYLLTREDPAPQSLIRLIDTLQGAGIPFLPYFTPLEYEVCEQVVGQRFRTRTEENKAVITTILKEHGVPFLDLSTALDSTKFLPDHYPSEHMTAAGRRLVAESLRDAVRRILDSRNDRLGL